MSRATGAQVVACDLDRTLIFSPSALDLKGSDADAPTLICVEIHEGRPLSFLTSVAHRHLKSLCEGRTLVPVTTRTVAQYRRVQLPGPPPPFAVCANGGRLLVAGVEDLGHTKLVQRTLREVAPLAEIEGLLTILARARPEIAKTRTADGLFCYVVLHKREDAASIGAEMSIMCDSRGWTVSVQGRKVYALPRGLSKCAAVRLVAERSGSDVVAAAGDALLDAEMIAAVPHAMVPRGSELARLPTLAGHALITSASGVLAGEEIAGWLSQGFGAGHAAKA